MKVAFVVPYPQGRAPSQRFRFEQYQDILEEEGIDYRFFPFFSVNAWHLIYRQGHAIAKLAWVIRGYLKRALLVFIIPGYDIVFIHRESTPFGPAWFEWLISRVLRKKIIYDLDDAIWIEDRSQVNSWTNAFRNYRKVSGIMRWSYRISAGNDYLAGYARRFASDVIVNPTTIETGYHDPSYCRRSEGHSVIGWTGTHSTAKYITDLLPELDRIYEEINFRFLFISNRDPEFHRPWFEFRKWSKDTEISDLCEMDIGLMPLEEDPWCEGKCGLKLLQYLSMGIVPIASAVGVNRQMIINGENGYLVQHKHEFIKHIRELLEDRQKVESIKSTGRKFVMDNYSVASNRSNFISLFNQ